MKINLYNRSHSTEVMGNEMKCFPANLLLSEFMNVYSWIASEMIFLIEIERMSDDLVITWAPSFVKNDEFAMRGVRLMQGALPIVKKIKAMKHKSQADLVRLGTFKKDMWQLRMIFKETLEYRLKGYGILELAPFENDKVMKLYFINHEINDIVEHSLITEITKTLIDREFIFNIDSSVEQIFSFELYNETQHNPCDFIKIPLWDFPVLKNMTYQELKYTRNMLQEKLVPFNENLKNLSSEIFDIPLSPENNSLLKNLGSDKLMAYKSSIQKEIDESIYINKSKNQNKVDVGVKFCVGITSADNLVNYFCKTDNIESYMSEEIKQRTARHIDLKSTYIFTYFEVHN